MIAPVSYESCSEAYIIEKTVEVVIDIAGESQTIRIEALCDLRDNHYSTRAYKQEHLTLQPTYPKTGGQHDRSLEDFQIWVNYDLPWTNRDSADEALSQALGFLSERCSN